MSDGMHTALLPCPLCGGDAAHGSVRYSDRIVADQRWLQDTFFKVGCCHCGTDNLGIVGHESPDRAARHWNTRAPDPALLRRIEVLQADNARLRAFASAHDSYMLDAGYEGPSSKALHPKAAANWRACRAALSTVEAETGREGGA